MRRRLMRRQPQHVGERLQLDDAYVRDQFARIARRAPRELRRPNPRIYALYLLPRED